MDDHMKPGTDTSEEQVLEQLGLPLLPSTTQPGHFALPAIPHLPCPPAGSQITCPTLAPAAQGAPRHTLCDSGPHNHQRHIPLCCQAGDQHLSHGLTVCVAILP